MNKMLLRYKMYVHGDTDDALAEALKIPKQELFQKMDETAGHEFTQCEIRSIRKRYNLTSGEIISIFFR